MKRATIVLFTLLFSVFAAASDAPSVAEIEDSLRATETAFAKTMEDRDFDAFATFLSENAIFSTPRGELRGRSQILEGWRPLYEAETPPFSWRPERVHVLDGGKLGGTTGPVIDPEGNVIGQFVSTWARQPDGSWKIVLDMAPNCQ